MICCTKSSLTKVIILINLLIFVEIQCTSLENKEREMIENDIVDKFQERFNNIKVVIDKMKMKMHALDVASGNQQEKLTVFIKLLQLVTHLLDDGNKPKPFPQISYVECPNNQLPESCYDISKCHSNIYSIMIPSYSNHSQAVSCDLKTENGGWTVIQRRQDGSVDFKRNWTEYVQGFGDLSGEFFIGLEKLHILTTQKPQELYIILEDVAGVQRYAKFQIFKVNSKDTDYKLTVGNYSGNAGNSLTHHNGAKFSTFDHNNDIAHCAKIFESGWWYIKGCFKRHLNVNYMMGNLSPSYSGHRLTWKSFHGYGYAPKFVQMMIRPRDD